MIFVYEEETRGIQVSENESVWIREGLQKLLEQTDESNNYIHLSPTNTLVFKRKTVHLSH
jgi:hypothetical protein